MAYCIHCGAEYLDGKFIEPHDPDCPNYGGVVQPVPRRNKYNARKVERDGYLFDSQLEADRYQILKLREQAGEITNLALQPKYQIHPAFVDRQGQKWQAIHYIADFEYLEGGQVVVEDTKGKETEVFRIKRKLFLRKYPQVDFRLVKKASE